MATESRLESSLRRSNTLAREVLRRASRRNVDWNNVGASQTSPTDAQTCYKDTHSRLNRALTSVTDFMAETTLQCRRFHQSECCADGTLAERNHVQRFHSSTSSRARASGSSGVRVSSEDFHVQVAAGTYSVTASVDESRPQTQVVTLTPGESVRLTFDL